MKSSENNGPISLVEEAKIYRENFSGIRGKTIITVTTHVYLGSNKSLYYCGKKYGKITSKILEALLGLMLSKRKSIIRKIQYKTIQIIMNERRELVTKVHLKTKSKIS